MGGLGSRVRVFRGLGFRVRFFWGGLGLRVPFLLLVRARGLGSRDYRVESASRATGTDTQALRTLHLKKHRVEIPNHV